MRTLMKIVTLLAGRAAAPDAPTDLAVSGSSGVADSLTPTVTATASVDDTAKDGSTHTYSVLLTLGGSPVALDNATGLTGAEIETGYVVDPTTGMVLALSDTAYAFVVRVTDVMTGLTADSEATAAAVNLVSAGIIGNWDYSDLTRLFQSAGVPVTADNDPIGVIADSIGTVNLAQTTTVNKPTYKAAIQNGRGAGLFDGADWLAAVVALLTGDFSIYIIHKPTVAGVIQGSINSVNDSSVAQRIACYADTRATTPRIANYAPDGTDRLLNATVIAENITRLVAVRAGGGVLEAYENGVSLGTLVIAGSTAGLNRLEFGRQASGSLYLIGYQMQICIANTRHSDAVFAAVQDYLNVKWGVT